MTVKQELTTDLAQALLAMPERFNTVSHTVVAIAVVYQQPTVSQVTLSWLTFTYRMIGKQSSTRYVWQALLR
ncbi:hypothetical protein [Thermogemmatispora tikiterensis]|uniref:Uncharacterized protein n=1 Tax=Thermogemmatispora tikiterensis TaxID=1825093 RepID=A0A328VJ15_9CHLR|nr:hypothetical protein [Thermogemmatispora tikiterensis]RAQ96871.1 hypothetical protein A4R35_15140 [Thermogemmatispora tikiterensis]